MLEHLQERQANLSKKFIDVIDQKHFRKIQGKAYRCAAVCCDNETYNAEEIYDCTENCFSTLKKAQNYFTEERQRVQDRLQRCVMDCTDKVRDKVGPTPTQNEFDKYKGDYERCASKCIDDYSNLLSALEKTMTTVLSSKEFQ